MYLGRGGAEKSLFYLVKLMDKSKFDITVFTVMANGKMERHFESIGVKVKTPFSCAIKGKSILAKSIDHILIKRIERMVKFNSNCLLKAATGEEYDIVVSYHVDSSCYAVGLPKIGKRIKYIHADLANSSSYVNDNEYLFRLKNPYDKVICVSNIAQAGFEKYFGNSASISVLLNPIDSEEVHRLSNERLADLPGKSYVCALGRLTKEKGFSRLIDVYKKLTEKSFPFDLVIMGEGLERENLLKKISDYGLTKSIKLMDYQNNPYPIIKNSKFLIVPSYAEGLSMTAMEAICLGVPVVSTCPSVGDILGDEPCGIITDNTFEGLYQGMAKMCSENFYLSTKIAAERRSVFLNGRNMVERVENLYKEMLKE